MTPISVRHERSVDVTAIRAIHDAAFGQDDESRIVDGLRDAGVERVSLVAEREGQVVGHVLFSPVTLEADGSDDSAGAASGDLPVGMALGPVAVLPAHQRQGIGSALIERGLGLLRERGCPYAVVLGHPEYYPRFGFRTASGLGLRCKWLVPEEVFMAQELVEGALEGVSALVCYRPEFG